jgi:hypothetical protein
MFARTFEVSTQRVSAHSLLTNLCGYRMRMSVEEKVNRIDKQQVSLERHTPFPVGVGRTTKKRSTEINGMATLGEEEEDTKV